MAIYPANNSKNRFIRLSPFVCHHQPRQHAQAAAFAFQSSLSPEPETEEWRCARTFGSGGLADEWGQTNERVASQRHHSCGRFMGSCNLHICTRVGTMNRDRSTSPGSDSLGASRNHRLPPACEGGTERAPAGGRPARRSPQGEGGFMESFHLPQHANWGHEHAIAPLIRSRLRGGTTFSPSAGEKASQGRFMGSCDVQKLT